ncbi:hypothetical protein M199_gp087 [Halogranum tailed virus 1]|uniref:Uncharacterized protein n=1 Tax=Halogranum tailed virus 1 TaxID=1273749 RepID=R4T764_9CAUD|nr:hypothetical protein M199_gp087 [Halogranum tailed virus 1]AGM11579.1 hypothetical protein HGTV1_282 [Halogranum tailed virus 1]
MELNRYRKTAIGARDVEEYGFGMEEIQENDTTRLRGERTD